MIDVTEIDWTKLSPEEFSQINAQLIEEKKLVRKTSEKIDGTTIIEVRGIEYVVKTKDYRKLLSFKSEKSRQKFLMKLILESERIKNI